MHWFSYKSIYYSINKTQLETHFQVIVQRCKRNKKYYAQSTVSKFKHVTLA